MGGGGGVIWYDGVYISQSNTDLKLYVTMFVVFDIKQK